MGTISRKYFQVKP